MRNEMAFICIVAFSVLFIIHFIHVPIHVNFESLKTVENH